MPSIDLRFAHPDATRWKELSRHASLAVLLDLDGTLIPFAPTLEEATLDRNALRTLEQLVAAGVQLAIVSGRPRAAIEPLIAGLPQAWWFAEHGAWRYIDGVWDGPAASAPELDALAETFAAIASVEGARIERKSLSVCVHWRCVEGPQRAALIAGIELAAEEWLESHPAYERLPGAELVEVRARAAHKGVAVELVRARTDDARIIAIGDDVTDEDMFLALGERDAAISVGYRYRHAYANAALTGPVAVRAFLHWIVDARTRSVSSLPPIAPVMELRPAVDRCSLLVVSNRTPNLSRDRRREIGGLASALEPALRDRRGMWLGWSGEVHERSTALVVEPFGTPVRARFGLAAEMRERFYAGFSNRVLWPLFHGFPGRVVYRDDEWEAYVDANALYAEHAAKLVDRDGVIWVNDYHLLLAAQALRARGHRGPIGMFLHTPFPEKSLLDTVPWRDALLEAMRDFDLIGFQTAQWADNFLAAVQATRDATVVEREVHARGRVTTVGVFPIAIDSTPYTLHTDEVPDVAGLRAALGHRRLLLGVDRLDHAKGIPERLLGYERFLERFPAWHGRVAFVQISVPSRADVPEYAELRHRVETLVGRINGRFGEADWVPVRYLYRAYEPSVLAQLYRLADVALVTPLRDGMNLVAKEFVASQELANPGVLVLSRFAGAASELTEAILTNPYHPDGVAHDIQRALDMPVGERRTRHERLLAQIERTTPVVWANAFLDRLVLAAARHAVPERDQRDHVLLS